MITLDKDQFDEHVLKCATLFFNKSKSLALKSDEDYLHINMKLEDIELFVKFPIVESEKDIQCIVNAKDFLNVMKIMSGSVRLEVTKDQLNVFTGSNHYSMALIDSEFGGFFFDYKLPDNSVKINNQKFELLRQHVNSPKAEDDSCFVFNDIDGNLIATDHFNFVLLASECKIQFMLDGMLLPFIGKVKEHFELKVNEKLVCLTNAYFTLITVNHEPDSIFPINLGAFDVSRYQFVCSFDSSDLRKRFGSMCSFIGSDNFEKGINWHIDKTNKMTAEGSSKTAKENCYFNNIQREIQVNLDVKTVDKILFCADGDVVDMYINEPVDGKVTILFLNGDILQASRGKVL